MCDTILSYYFFICPLIRFQTTFCLVCYFPANFPKSDINQIKSDKSDTRVPPPIPTAHQRSHIMSRLTRFRQLPLTLYRIQPRLQVSLRDFDTQMAKKRESYDLKLHNGLVLPMTGDTFHTPNGMSLRPNSDTMVRILNQFRGDVNVYSILQGTILPDDLVVIHEHTDHYSMQTTVPVSLPDLNAKMTELLSKCMCVTREEFLARLEDLDDQDN